MITESCDDAKNRRLLLHLESSFERQWLQKENLEKKANNAIQVCGLIFGVLFGILNLSFSGVPSIPNKLMIPEESLYLLLGGMITSLICIIISSAITKLEIISFVFADTDKNRKLFLDTTLKELEYVKTAIDDYIKGIDKLVRVNRRKAHKIKFMQFFMIASILQLLSSSLITFYSIMINTYRVVLLN